MGQNTNSNASSSSSSSSSSDTAPMPQPVISDIRVRTQPNVPDPIVNEPQTTTVPVTPVHMGARDCKVGIKCEGDVVALDDPLLSFLNAYKLSDIFKPLKQMGITLDILMNEEVTKNSEIKTLCTGMSENKSMCQAYGLRLTMAVVDKRKKNKRRKRKSISIF